MSGQEVPTGERFKCTYPKCLSYFDTEKEMRLHKLENTQDHHFCRVCDMDFESGKDQTLHQAYTPDKHYRACRLCGQEFRTKTALQRHVELTHPIRATLVCPGCNNVFSSPQSFIEHMEFGHCRVIAAHELTGHVVHKLLLHDMLGDTYQQRHMENTAHFHSSFGYEATPGLGYDDLLEQDDDDISGVDYEAIKPEPESPLQAASAGTDGHESGSIFGAPSIDSFGSPSIISGLADMSLGGGSSGDGDEKPGKDASAPETPTSKPELNSSGTRTGKEPSTESMALVKADPESETEPVLKAWGKRTEKEPFPEAMHPVKKPKTETKEPEVKPWGSRPGAKPAPAPKPAEKQFSVEAADRITNEDRGIDLFRKRVWDPMSKDYNPEPFFNTVIQKYFCPFPCDCNYDDVAGLSKHIVGSHRLNRAKCPHCLKYFGSLSQLMSHCQAHGSKCEINRKCDYDKFLDKLTGGFLCVDTKVRPDHDTGAWVDIKDARTGKMVRHHPAKMPLEVTYLEYSTGKPMDWVEPDERNGKFGRHG